MIYFMQPTAGGPVKIGVTDDLDARHRQLERHYGCELAILATMPGDRDTETEIHERFGHLRFGRTEQFRPAPDLFAFIGRPLLVGANPEAVEAMGVSEARKPMVVQIRGSEAWKEWVEGLARKEGDTLAKLFERAVRKWAKDAGYSEPPER